MSNLKKQQYEKTLEEFKKLTDKIKLGGGLESTEKHKKRGKLTARERIEGIKDIGTDFLELSLLAGFELYEDEVASAGILTGIALIHGRPCMIVANDATVKGGTYYPITVKKHLRAQEIALKNKLPCIYLVDSGGAFLPKQDEVFPDKEHFGRIFYNQAKMSALKIPQISSVHGFCTAGGAYIPAMSDQSIIVKNTGTIFLGGPPLVKAATGEEVSAEELGGAHVHTSISGVADYLAENDEHALALIREIIYNLSLETTPAQMIESSEPLYPIDDLLSILPFSPTDPCNMYEVMDRILDHSSWFEFKPNYGKTLITAFSHLGGIKVGVIANNGVLFSESALKGTHFIELCTAQKIPLLFLQNITGFMVGKKYEHEGIAKHGAKMVHAVSCANVPKISVIIGGSFGAGNYGMCGRAFDPNFLFTLPNSKISVMGAAQAASVMLTVKKEQLALKNKTMSAAEEKALVEPILEKYEKEGHAYYGSARLWDDGVIDPRMLRKTLIQALGVCVSSTISETNFGIFRM